MKREGMSAVVVLLVAVCWVSAVAALEPDAAC